MKNKWLYFHTRMTSLQFGVNYGNANIVHDWQGHWNYIRINGQSLAAIASQYGLDRDDTDRKRFERQLKLLFREKILEKIPENLKDKAAGHLITTFHQGGYLRPTSSSISLLFSKTRCGLSPLDKNCTNRINIVTTSDGFTIQEISTIPHFNVTPEASEDLEEQYPNRTINPDPGYAFCMEAQMTIKLSFTESGIEQHINSNISYGNAFIQAIADKREWYIRLLDYLKYLLGCNAVRDLSELDTSQENQLITP